jgi:hypothetical protein
MTSSDRARAQPAAIMNPSGDGTDSGPVETAPRLLDRGAFDRLCRAGLTSGQAGDLTARLAGMHPARGTTWDLAEIQRLAFLRWLVSTGRLQR